MVRMRLRGSSELDEVREAIGLCPPGPVVELSSLGQLALGAAVPRSDGVRSAGRPVGSLSRGMRRLAGVVSAVSGGVALTHQVLAGALASAHGAGPWGAAAMLLAWPTPLLQPILAGIGALVLCAVGVATQGWRHTGLGQIWLVVVGTMAAVLGAGPMVLVCVLTAVAFVLAVIVGLVILFYILTRLLQ